MSQRRAYLLPAGKTYVSIQRASKYTGVRLLSESSIVGPLRIPNLDPSWTDKGFGTVSRVPTAVHLTDRTGEARREEELQWIRMMKKKRGLRNIDIVRSDTSDHIVTTMTVADRNVSTIRRDTRIRATLGAPNSTTQ